MSASLGPGDPSTEPRVDAADQPLGLSAAGFGWTYRRASRPALEGITFQLDPGQALLVLGPSGSGKSTLVRALAGLVPHAMPGSWRGRLHVGEMSIPETGPGVIGGRVGIVFQDPESQIVMSRVEDEVAFGLENRGWPPQQMRDRVHVALEASGLAGFERRGTAQLSGGEQQRLAIADVLAPQPAVLLFDEPTASLDPPGMEAVFDRIGRLAAQGRHTIVIVEHRVDAALAIADRVLLLDDQGRQIAFGEPDRVGRDHAITLERLGGWVPDVWRGWLSDVAPVRQRRRAPALPVANPRSSRPGLDGPAGPTGRTGPVPVLEAARLTLGYAAESGGRRVVLRDVDLALEAGTRTALVGPNGSGKSTLLFALAGLRRPDAGWVAIGDGHRLPWTDPARVRGDALARLVGLVFQEPELGFVERTVAAEVSGGRPGRRDRERVTGEVAAILERFGLTALADRDPYTLSQGEQRRLSLASASWGAPGVLLLDEPTYGLDRRGSDAVIALLDELRTLGQAQLLATHDPRLLPACDRVVALVGGRIGHDGPVETFLSAPPYWPAAPWQRTLVPRGAARP